MSTVIDQLRGRVETVKSTLSTFPAIQKIKSTAGFGGLGLLKGSTFQAQALDIVEKIKSVPTVQKVQSIPAIQKVQSLPIVTNIKTSVQTVKSVGIGKGGIVQGLSSFPMIKSVQSRLKAPAPAAQVMEQTIKPDMSVALQESAYVAARKRTDISVEV
jgi:hypothetical protein